MLKELFHTFCVQSNCNCSEHLHRVPHLLYHAQLDDLLKDIVVKNQLDDLLKDIVVKKRHESCSRLSFVIHGLPAPRNIERDDLKFSGKTRSQRLDDFRRVIILTPCCHFEDLADPVLRQVHTRGFLLQLPKIMEAQVDLG